MCRGTTRLEATGDKGDRPEVRSEDRRGQVLAFAFEHCNLQMLLASAYPLRGSATFSLVVGNPNDGHGNSPIFFMCSSDSRLLAFLRPSLILSLSSHSFLSRESLLSSDDDFVLPLRV